MSEYVHILEVGHLMEEEEIHFFLARVSVFKYQFILAARAFKAHALKVRQVP